MQKQIEVVPYNSEWPVTFTREAKLIKQALGNNCLEIHHVGSTSVPNLAAKPKIDLIVVAKDAFLTHQPLAEIGFKYGGEYSIPMRHLFTKRGEIDFNLHLYEQNHPEIELNLFFRDYLRTHEEVRQAYQQLKYDILQAEFAHEKTNDSYRNYTLLKGDFIRAILKKTGIKRLRIFGCLHEVEWQAAKYFRGRYFFSAQSIDDPYTWTFNHPEHAHLILYQGVDIIGYAHLQFWPKNRAAIRIIVVDENKRNTGMGSEFLALIEKWLKSSGIKSIHAESRQNSLQFYLKNGYQKMSFADPQDHEIDTNDIAVGKVL